MSLCCSFKVEVFSKYSILFNEAKSKAFLCIRLNLDDDPADDGDSDIVKLIRCVDQALREFQQLEYHQVRTLPLRSIYRLCLLAVVVFSSCVVRK